MTTEEEKKIKKPKTTKWQYIFFKEIRRYKFVTYRRKRRDYKVVITYWAIKAVV
jgi:hypothetical protein